MNVNLIQGGIQQTLGLRAGAARAQAATKSARERDEMEMEGEELSSVEDEYQNQYQTGLKTDENMLVGPSNIQKL